MTQFDFKKLVDAEYLLNNRTNKNIVVIDARGGMLEEGSLMYDKATVVDWTDISLLGEFGGEELGKLLSKENYQQIFDKLGINDDSEVLVYGFTMPEQGFGDEARVVYTFNYAGFENVKFIDGGFKQVEKLGFNKNYEPTKDRINVSDVVRNEATQNDKAIFTDGFLKSREELEKYVNEKGLDKNRLQITYCTTGVRASYVAVILEELGFNVRNYEPSFARYANVGEVE